MWGVGPCAAAACSLVYGLLSLTRRGNPGCNSSRGLWKGVSPLIIAAQRPHPANAAVPDSRPGIIQILHPTHRASTNTGRRVSSRNPKRDRDRLPKLTLELCARHAKVQESLAAPVHHVEQTGSYPRPKSCGRLARGRVPLVPWLERRSLVSAQVRLHVLCEFPVTPPRPWLIVCGHF